MYTLTMFTSCNSLKLTELIIIGTNNTYLEVKNGERLLVSDTFTISPITDLAYSDSVLINFSDSITVYFNNEYRTEYHNKKLNKGKYLIIWYKGYLDIYSSDNPGTLY